MEKNSFFYSCPFEKFQKLILNIDDGEGGHKETRFLATKKTLTLIPALYFNPNRRSSSWVNQSLTS